MNIDQKTAQATVSENKISIKDAGRSCIQLTQLKTTTVSGNTMNLTGGNAITLHENLLTSAVPAVSISNNTITGTGYLIYDDAKANNKTFNSDNLKLTMNGNTVASTVNTTQGVKNGTVYGTSDVVTGQVSAGVTVQQSTGGYYYHPTTDTKADETKGSPKTFDAGVGIYAVTAVLSVAGMAWVGKKRH